MKRVEYELDPEFTKYLYDPEIKADIDAYFYAKDYVEEQEALDNYRARYNAMTPEQQADYDKRATENILHLIRCTQQDMNAALARIERSQKEGQRPFSRMAATLPH